MTYKEYQENSGRTCADLNNLKLNLAHMIIGLYSEQNEVDSAAKNFDLVNYGEELTDQNWYLANYCTFRNLLFETVYTNMFENNFTLEQNFSKLADIVKKYIVYNKEIDTNYEMHLLNSIAFGLYEKYITNDLDIKKCLQNNIDKLRIRFPDKYSDQLALNRNLEQERIELEK